mmetsp:Transcript_23848/g.20818  ORF Transcript_23848/g.20818 Transcript_23848/m.20818 type:complete len:125 (-) Transcript_23848:1264-1638(-)
MINDLLCEERIMSSTALLFLRLGLWLWLGLLLLLLLLLANFVSETCWEHRLLLLGLLLLLLLLLRWASLHKGASKIEHTTSGSILIARLLLLELVQSKLEDVSSLAEVALIVISLGFLFLESNS